VTGGLGIMLDDLLAGIYALLVMLLLEQSGVF
jgi:phosphatidylglycerophosphatase A